jgi:hypothetical protein
MSEQCCGVEFIHILDGIHGGDIHQKTITKEGNEQGKKGINGSNLYFVNHAANDRVKSLGINPDV